MNKMTRWFIGLAAIAVAVAVILFCPLPSMLRWQSNFVGRAFLCLLLSAFLCLWRVLRGPTAPDRAVAIDMLGILIVGFCAVLSIPTGRDWYIDIGIAWALQSFIGIMALAVFFTVLGAIKDRFSSSKFIKIKKLLNQPEKVTLHLASGKTVADVHFVGFTDPASLKGVPYQLSNMVVFETTDGRRVLLRADTIRMMEEQRKTPNQTLHATSEPAPSAVSSSHEG
jgi:multicomponent Na+:H+ antiporter subunit F